MQSVRRGAARGFTLIELMVAIAVLAIGAMAVMGSFRYIATSVQFSKGRTIANNMGQEQVEKLKNLSYYSLLVTTNTVTGGDTRFSPPLYYDTGNYPAQTINEGGILFTRATRVDFASQSGTTISTVSWTSDDTGIKLITVYVIWQDGGSWRYRQLQNLMANPAANPLNATFTGTVRSNATGNPVVPGARVQVVENPNWYGYTDNSGVYRFNVSTGAYTLQCSSAGYFTVDSAYQPIVSGQTRTVDFTLGRMSSGTVVGSAYINDHVVISQIVASTDTNVDFVELYNSSSTDVNVGSVGSGWDPNGFMGYSEYSDENGNWKGGYIVRISTFIPANKYYLIANTASPIHVGGVTRQPDATWPASWLAPTHFIDENLAGGVYLYFWNQVAGTWLIYDRVGWSRTNGGGHAAPGWLVNGSPYVMASGFTDGDALIRFNKPGIVDGTSARAYDSQDNSHDFLFTNPPIAPNTTAQGTQMPTAGTPAIGAIVNLNDPLSTPGVCTIAYVTNSNCMVGGAPGCKTCSFTVTGVATGTWTADVTSGNLYSQIQNISVTANVSTGVPNASTTPAWNTAGSTTTLLMNSTSYAFVTGTITDATNNPINHLEVSDGNGRTAFTASTGKYTLMASTGAGTITANPADANVNRSYVIAQPVSPGLSGPLTAGQLYDNENATLSLAGTIVGYFQTSSATPLPGRTAVALIGSNQMAQAVSDNSGHFYLLNLATGTYVIQPSLDPAETASPPGTTVTLASTGTATGVSTFTVTNGLAQITGQVQVASSSSAITTGVLVIATTGTLSGGSTTPPPAMTGSAGGSCNPCYYSTSSDATGAFTVSVRSDSVNPYHLYGWYTTFSGSSPSISRKNYTVNVSSGGQIVSQNLAW